ncbi:hypothetical protein AVDCRST_MAG92-3619 [uncultured Coleofasciculus sp.]|uniref:Uncharacterized protein n=1 Tax=uncultured Coleofasciculus sp. TaxID=1267456 RepID=A0A6J4JM77_9CYAN|nr:hypothetical protein AVDCRST_MAG92-3619 [uncultured Coleofasciculus sp.]
MLAFLIFIVRKPVTTLHKAFNMIPMYLIFLASALGSIFIFLRASQEILRLLAIGCAIFCSIFGFALAPWPIQLLIFLLILQMERLYPFHRAGEVPVTLSSPKQRR